MMGLVVGWSDTLKVIKELEKEIEVLKHSLGSLGTILT